MCHRDTFVALDRLNYCAVSNVRLRPGNLNERSLHVYRGPIVGDLLGDLPFWVLEIIDPGLDDRFTWLESMTADQLKSSAS